MTNVHPIDTAKTPSQGTQQAAQFAGLLERSRALMSDSLDRAVSGMLEKLPRDLQALIEETRSLEERRLYEETRQVVMTQLEAMKQQFRTSYLGEFRRRSDRARRIGPEAAASDEPLLKLELVGEDDYDETLQINAMAGRLRAYCDEELSGLDQRVGVLLGDANLQASDNPFSPQVFCDAYKQACRSATGDTKVRRQLIKLFDEHVLDDVRSMYRAVNALLIENAILPKIRYSYARARQPAVAAPGAAPAPAATAAAVAGDGAAAPETGTSAATDWFTLLQQLVAAGPAALGQTGPAAGLTSGTAPTVGAGSVTGSVAGVAGPGGVMLPTVAGGAASGGVPGAPGAGPVLQGPALLGTLTRIQLGDVNAVEGTATLAAGVADPGTTNVLRELRVSSVGGSMAAMDLMTLDIVAMLFDQLFDDPKVPNGVKGLIGRLQIPMLKVAIADKSFFSTRTHPARRLLDTLGEFAARLDAGFGPDDPLFAPVQTTLEELVAGYRDDVEIFTAARERLEAVLADEERRVEEGTRAAARRVEEMERLAVAKMAAAQEIKARVESRRLPQPVVDCLVQQWLKLLLLVHVKEGPESDDWRRALETMDQLIWSIEPKGTREARREVVAVIPRLVRQLALGLKAAGVRSAQRTEFFAQLMKIHRQAIIPPNEAEAAAGGNADVHDAHAVDATLDFSTPVTVRNPFGEGEVDVSSVDFDFTALETAGRVADVQDAAASLVASLAMGTWVEFREDGEEERRRPARLVFVTPRKTRYLFSFDRAGKDITPYTPAELNRRFRLGGIVVIEEPRDESLFDRIMGGLLGRLRVPGTRAA